VSSGKNYYFQKRGKGLEDPGKKSHGSGLFKKKLREAELREKE